jgi:hypothetical protein
LEAAEISYLDGVEGLCNSILKHHTFVSQDYFDDTLRSYKNRWDAECWVNLGCACFLL